MNKKLMFLLATAAVMASCSEESIVDSEKNRPSNLIGFNTYKTVTRGNPIDNDDEFRTDGNKFGVTAFISTDIDGSNPYMGTIKEGISIKASGGKWVYDDEKNMHYWPANDETLDFYAYYPYKDDAITDKTFSRKNGIILGYTVPEEEGNQVDLMFASKKKVGKPKDNKVTLLFKHALTQVHFEVATKTDGLEIDIKKDGIKIHNIPHSKGIFTLPEEDEENGWASDGEPDYADYIVTSDQVTGEYQGETKENFEKVSKDNNALMLIPQEFAAWELPEQEPESEEVSRPEPEEDEKGGYLSISCKIRQKYGDSGITYLVGSNDNFATIYVPFSSNNVWNRGKKVTYKLLIGDGSILNPIEFETEVESWDPVDGGKIEI